MEAVHHFLHHLKQLYFKLLPADIQEEICTDPLAVPIGRAAFTAGDGHVRSRPPAGWGFWSIGAGDPTVVTPLRFSRYGCWRANPPRKSDKFSPIKSSIYEVYSLCL